MNVKINTFAGDEKQCAYMGTVELAQSSKALNDR